MKTLAKLILVSTALLLSTTSTAQDNTHDDAEQLKIAAMDALMMAPPERALPLVEKVLSGDHSVELKERALFILSQIDDGAAQATLLRFAEESNGELQTEAIRMIGIGGNADSLAALKPIYESGGVQAKEAVIQAYMIADDKQAVFELAVNAEGDAFEEAVQMLGAMGAHEELRELLSRTGPSEALIQAYAISGDSAELQRMAMDSSDPDLQIQAIEAMGIVGGADVDAALVQIYRDAPNDEIREAALDGLLISGNDTGIMELYRSSDDAATKKELLERLVIMGSDEVWDIIDSAFDGGE